jgi:hypothetical protein
MDKPIGSIRAHRVTVDRETSASNTPPDYQDAFEVPTNKTDTRTPERAGQVIQAASRSSAKSCWERARTCRLWTTAHRPRPEEILAHAAIACASSLPLTHMSQGMLDSDPFAQFGPSLRGLLAFA